MFNQLAVLGLVSWGGVLVLGGAMMVASWRKHLLTTLLSLEFTVLGLFLWVSWGLILSRGGVFFRIVFLALSVCEGRLGLAILITMVRAHGNDYFQGISVL